MWKWWSKRVLNKIYWLTKWIQTFLIKIIPDNGAHTSTPLSPRTTAISRVLVNCYQRAFSHTTQVAACVALSPRARRPYSPNSPVGDGLLKLLFYDKINDVLIFAGSRDHRLRPLSFCLSVKRRRIYPRQRTDVTRETR